MTRVANVAQYDRMVSLIMQAQSQAGDAQLQIASGRKSQTYQGIAHDASRLVGIEVSHVRVNQYVDNNSQIEDRLQLMEGSVGQVINIMGQFKSLLINALNHGNAVELDLSNQTTEMMKQVSTLLNVDLDGRHLFAGSMTGTEPVDLSALPISYTIPSSDGDAAGYYQADAVRLKVRADDNLDITYGVNADALGFEQLIRAMDMVVKGAPTDTTMLNHALDVVNTASENVTDIRTRIGNARSSLATIEKSHQDFLLFAEETISDLENTDITLAITRLNETQVTLEASYMALSRLSQVSLMQYIR